MRIWKRTWTFSSAGYSSDGPFRRMNKKQLHTTTSTIKLLLHYIHYNYTIQLYKRQVFLSAHYLLNWKQSWVYSRGGNWSISLWIIKCVQSQCISSASVKCDSAVWSGECRKLMMFSNVIVDITFPFHPHVFAQSLLWGFCQSLRCRKLGSRSNWSNKPLPVKEQLQRRLHPTKHSPTYCNYRNKPQRNSYDYSNHTVHKGHVWEHLGHPKTFNIHVAHKLITNLRQLRTNVKNKERFIRSTL